MFQTEHVNEKSVPMLILHGDSDPLVPLSQSVIMHDSMIAASKEWNSYILEGVGHGTDEF